MARKDDILRSFLTHELLESKYDIKKEELPSSIREALNSDKSIIKAIALIVEGLDGSTQVTDSVLRNQVTQFLNEAL
ncbi:hypothetical protein VR610_10140 [Aquirufa regiilacus]|uniref:hypothetical protein n=1 Tax=Aquirufa regiilacus TaxID=3024868 RepID=UPI0028DFD3E7|nr:hypothetical protein [Aquirufa sp. LEPPI-3A]MDT8887817.1 hypothetical protein [Aquirufa sp. LEPPI-3A]